MKKKKLEQQKPESAGKVILHESGFAFGTNEHLAQHTKLNESVR